MKFCEKGWRMTMAIKIEKVNFLGWENSVKLSNGIIDVVATTDIGPRIVRFGFENDVNEFNLDPKTIGVLKTERGRMCQTMNQLIGTK
jgi:hypothetical protein